MSIMNQKSVSAYILCMLVVSSGFCYGYRHHRTEEQSLLAPEPQEVIRSDGGRVQAWIDHDFKILRNADLAAAVITIEGNSLQLPKYSDTASLLYVVEGRARVGLISPVGINANIRHIKKGDVWAIPRGWAHWIWNEDESQQLRLIGVAETSTVTKSGFYTPFYLTGGDQEYAGGLLHGFSAEVLAQAWNVEVDDIQKLLEGQSESGFFKWNQEQKPDIPTEPSSALLGDFVYNFDDTEPDVIVPNGGALHQLTGRKLPVLWKIGLGITRVHLLKGAIVAPQFLTNAHRLIYIIEGKGHVEISFPDGKNALSEDVKEGDVIIVPPGYPAVERADDNEDLRYLSFAGSALPIPAFLAGGNSVFQAIPKVVRNVAFNIDEELSKKLDKVRRHEFGIFPPRQQSSRWYGQAAGSTEALIRDFQNFMNEAKAAMHQEIGIQLP